MIKNGNFCLINSIEYEFSSDMKGNCKIRTIDKSKIDESFTDKYNCGIFSKKVNRSDIQEIYSCNTIAKIGNVSVHVDKELDNSYLVGTGSPEVAKQLGLHMVDKYYYEGEIPKKDAIISIEKTEIY
ncbi:hypothetical protein [Clostridium sp. HBUAS56017]|uniref:hypothetical protein n=1 Tax=Clostridium sp. HBUAS56017 TaxID=2571128 RepID=UPI001177B38D|nr:hypothetical protein [Clostridium sp. HBUAS56017]